MFACLASVPFLFWDEWIRLSLKTHPEVFVTRPSRRGVLLGPVLRPLGGPQLPPLTPPTSCCPPPPGGVSLHRSPWGVLAPTLSLSLVINNSFLSYGRKNLKNPLRAIPGAWGIALDIFTTLVESIVYRQRVNPVHDTLSSMRGVLFPSLYFH